MERAGNCSGWTSLELCFPPYSGSIHVRLREKGWLWSGFHAVMAISCKRRRGTLLHGDIPLLPPLAARICRERKKVLKVSALLANITRRRFNICA